MFACTVFCNYRFMTCLGCNGIDTAENESDRIVVTSQCNGHVHDDQTCLKQNLTLVHAYTTCGVTDLMFVSLLP